VPGNQRGFLSSSSRTRVELAAQEELFPSEAAVAFGADEAALPSRLYKEMARAHGREIDVAVARAPSGRLVEC
jgi:hypothetical protein